MASVPDSPIPASTPEEAFHQIDTLSLLVSDGILLVRTGGVVLRVNPAAVRALGWAEEEILNGRVPGLFGEDPGVIQSLLERARTGFARGEIAFRCRDGGPFVTEVRCAPVPCPGGEPCALVSFRDPSEERRIERTFRERETEFLEAQRIAGLGAWTADPATGTVRWSEETFRIYGLPREGGAPDREAFLRMIHPDDRPRVEESVRAWAAGEAVDDMLFRIERPDGTTRVLRGRGEFTSTGPGRSPRVIGIVQDVTERNAELEQVRMRGSLLSAVLDTAAAGVLVVGNSGRILATNRAFQTMWRVPDEILATGDDERILDHVMGQLAEPAAFRREVERLYYSPEETNDTVRLADGRTFDRLSRPFTFDGPRGRLWTFRDVTEQRALQAQLAMASRLASLGTLVSGVAHEINNPLSALMAEAGIASEIAQELHGQLRGAGTLDREAGGERLEAIIEALHSAQESSKRVARIVKDLSIYGRPNAPRERMRLQDVVESALRWLPSFVGKVATVQVENAGAPDVQVAPGQIEQVVVNLVVNGAHAMESGRRGFIIVRILTGPEGSARLEVVDQGTGIEPAILDRIFDPYFTTRADGQGVGLGLAISHAIVSAHGGGLTAESKVGRGATFRVDLPAAPSDSPTR